MDTEKIISSLVPSLATAIVTALLTVKLSLRRFYSEQWWGKKAQTYVDILTALYRVKAHLTGQWRDQYSAEALGDDEKGALRRRAREGIDQIQMAIALGTFFISPEARRCLDGLSAAISQWNLPESYGVTDKVSAAIDKCINDLSAAAKVDLKVR